MWGKIWGGGALAPQAPDERRLCPCTWHKGDSIDWEFEFYEFFSFLKFNEFYKFFLVEKNRKKFVILQIIDF